jgi:hypothetical protein
VEGKPLESAKIAWRNALLSWGLKVAARYISDPTDRGLGVSSVWAMTVRVEGSSISVSRSSNARGLSNMFEPDILAMTPEVEEEEYSGGRMKEGLSWMLKRNEGVWLEEKIAKVNKIEA